MGATMCAFAKKWRQKSRYPMRSGAIRYNDHREPSTWVGQTRGHIASRSPLGCVVPSDSLMIWKPATSRFDFQPEMQFDSLTQMASNVVLNGRCVTQWIGQTCIAGIWLVFIIGTLAMAQTADVVFYGGFVATLDDAASPATAVAISGERILAVGRDEEILKLARSHTRRIDLDGRFLMPGFIDCHGHFLSLGESRLQVDVSGVADWQELVRRVAGAAKNKAPGQWIVGRGWHQEKWTSLPADAVAGYPVHDALSIAVPDHPVLLVHATGHMVLANQYAMQRAGVTAQTADVPGGLILRKPDGAPTGVFRENAMRLIYRAYERWKQERPESEKKSERLRALELAQEECLRFGVTSFHDAGSSLEDVELFREAVDQDRLRIRLYVMLNESNERLEPHLAWLRMVDYGGGRLTVRAIKRIADGALGTHGAWMLAPYDDMPGELGNVVTPMDVLRRTAHLALKHDYQLCVHAIGDRANREVLDVFEELMTASGKGAELRWRIEHAQHLHPDDIPRFGRLGIIASMQAVHAVSDGPFVVERLGWRRAAEGAYAWASLLKHGARIANGTDVPVEPIDPIGNYLAAITRRMSNGEPFFPEQAMNRLQALRSYTRDAAFAAFEEDRKGILRPGAWADLVVVSENLLEAPEEKLRQARIESTMIGGRIEYAIRPQDRSP